jgi:hypothetical protein
MRDGSTDALSIVGDLLEYLEVAANPLEIYTPFVVRESRECT